MTGARAALQRGSRLPAGALTFPTNPELSLAIACCRWPLDEAAHKAIADAAELTNDWNRFARIVARNRIRPLVYRALIDARVDLPQRFANHLQTTATGAITRALALSRESLRLQHAFRCAGMEMLLLKGIPVGMLAYGRNGMKEARDIDLLVSPAEVTRAARLLTDLGYQHGLGHLSPDQFDGFTHRAKEMEFFHPVSGITTELHWRLVDVPTLLRGVDVHSPSQEVRIPGGALYTLAERELFAYLCVHGAAHAWARLKWLAELSAFLVPRSEDELTELYHAAAAIGAARSAALSLTLCHRFFGLPMHEELRLEFDRSGAVRALERNVLTILSHGGGTAEFGPRTVPHLRSLAGRFLLAPGGAHVLRVAWVLWNVPVDRTRILLPAHLDFLYPLLRLPLWLWRAAQRTTAHAFGRAKRTGSAV